MVLSDFLAALLLDSSDGAGEALRLQEERRAELARAAALDVAEFARQTVTDLELNDEAARLFPAGDSRQPHGIYVGAAYVPALKTGEVEKPAILALAGIQLEPADYVQQRGTSEFALSKVGVETILTALRTSLGAQYQSSLRRVLARGIPQVAVASGRVKVKLALSFDSAPPLATGTVAAPTARTATSRTAGPANVIPRRAARLLVRMIDDRAPQNQQLNVDILSELEVTFKSIT